MSDLISNNRLGLHINGNAFSWKIIIWKVWALILNFTTMKHGGARGGAESFWWLVNLSDSSEFWKIPTILRLWEGRWWRGAWRGVKMEGRVLAYMAGRQRGAGSTYTAFYTEKNVIFVIWALIDAQWIAPRLPPLHNMASRIVKYETRSSTTIKNHCFWIKTHFFKLMENLLYDF